MESLLKLLKINAVITGYPLIKFCKVYARSYTHILIITVPPLMIKQYLSRDDTDIIHTDSDVSITNDADIINNSVSNIFITVRIRIKA